MKYYFKNNNNEFFISMNLETGKYEIFNKLLKRVDSGHTLFQVTEKNIKQYCKSITHEFINKKG